MSPLPLPEGWEFVCGAVLGTVLVSLVSIGHFIVASRRIWDSGYCHGVDMERARQRKLTEAVVHRHDFRGRTLADFANGTHGTHGTDGTDGTDGKNGKNGKNEGGGL